LYAKSVVLPGENRENFEQLCDAFEKKWQPQQARLQRAFTRAQHELQILQKERRRQSARPPQAVPLEISGDVKNQPGSGMPGRSLPPIGRGAEMDVAATRALVQ
jgi:hypothetical protein